MTDLRDLLSAFDILEDDGWFTGRNLACCTNCGWGEVPKESENAVFCECHQVMNRRMNCIGQRLSQAGAALLPNEVGN